MKKFALGCIMFLSLVTLVFGQVPGVVVSDFTVRTRDVSTDEAVILTDMFMENLAAEKAVKVIDRPMLERMLTTLKFDPSDWSGIDKTAKLGESLKADFLVSGNLTQLGSNRLV